MKILRLSNSGLPLNWITPEEACVFFARNLVTWSSGTSIKIFKGGFSRKLMKQSEISIFPVIASGKDFVKFKTPLLSNSSLFRRDNNTCMYCGEKFPDKKLTRDHIIPVSKNGKNIWTNVVACCLRCNQKKGDKSLEKTGMKLIAVPYTPNHGEYLILQNRHIIYDQMEFLSCYARNENLKNMYTS